LKVVSYDLTLYLTKVNAKFSNVLFFVLIAHIGVSVFFILDLPFSRLTPLSRVYNTHFLPGPFFTDSRIIDNYSLSLSWKINGKWSSAFDPAMDDFNQYHASLNSSDLYRSRISRTLYLRLALLDSSETDIKNRREFIPLRQFLDDYYVPAEADSVRMWIINKQAKNYLVRIDSVSVTFSK
jgi:hypothetical protein